MKVFARWSKSEFIQRHVPDEFHDLATSLSCAQLEKLSEAIDAYRSRISDYTLGWITAPHCRSFTFRGECYDVTQR